MLRVGAWELGRRTRPSGGLDVPDDVSRRLFCVPAVMRHDNGTHSAERRRMRGPGFRGDA